MNMLLSITLGFVLAIYLHSALAGTVSDTFSTGDTLTADHLNNIKDAVNDNSLRITNAQSVNVNGIRIGVYIDSIGGNFSAAEGYLVLLDSGYFAFVSTQGTGLMAYSMFYETADCTGQPYDQSGPNPTIRNQGYVYSVDSPAPGTAYYVPAGTIEETRTFQSYIQDGICQPVGGAPTQALKVYLNEVSITGVTETDFVGDLTVGF